MVKLSRSAAGGATLSRISGSSSHGCPSVRQMRLGWWRRRLPQRQYHDPLQSDRNKRLNLFKLLTERHAGAADEEEEVERDQIA